MQGTDLHVPIHDPQAERSMASDKPGMLIRRAFRDLFEKHGEPIDA